MRSAEPKFASVRQSNTDENGFCTITCRDEQKALRRMDKLLKTDFWEFFSDQREGDKYIITMRVKGFNQPPNHNHID